MNNESIERIEAKVAYLEAANSELSDVVYRQQQELNELRARLTVLLGRLDVSTTAQSDYTLEQEKPPHY